MKILFFIDSLRAGGKERRLTELLKRLKEVSEIDFELVLMSRDIHYKDILNIGIGIHYVTRKTKKDLTVFGKFYKICKKYKPDIVQSCDSMTAIYLAPICRLLNIKFINAMISDAPVNLNILNKSWFRAKATFLFSDLIIGNSRAGIDAYKAPANKSRVIHNGFDFRRINNIRDKEDIRQELKIGKEYLVGMVASFSARKDYKTYIDAAQILLDKRTDLVFLLIGQNTDSPILKGWVPGEIKDHFRFLGKKTGVESYINVMDVGVLATFTEGISNAIMEYMALGKPVVATAGGGTPEIVVDGETGFLVKAADAEGMAEKIERLLNQSEKRNQMGKLGKERIQSLFSLDNMVTKYMKIYKAS